MQELGSGDVELGPAGQARAEGVVPTPPGQSIITVSVTAGSHANGWAQQTVTRQLGQ